MKPYSLLPYAGSAAPPGGWRDLVRREPRFLRRGLVPGPVYLNEASVRAALETQQALWRQFFYRPDVEERWQRPRWQRQRLLFGGWRWMLTGDGEDFALELRARLEDRVRPGALRLVQCWTERGEAHLVLALDSFNQGTLIADNRRPLIHWTRIGYRFEGGVTEVPGRLRWAWNLQAPRLADLLKSSVPGTA